MEQEDIQHSPPQGTPLSAALLIAGTCIGGGMLALPVTTGIAGFLPSTLVLLVCWVMMTCSGLLLLEANLWMEEGAHVFTMASRLLGPFGKIIAWVLYPFIGYASLVAYTAGGGAQVEQATKHFFGLDIPHTLGCVLFVSLFLAVIFLGSHFVGRVNALLFTGMVGAYVLLIGMGLQEVSWTRLFAQRTWGASWLAVPMFLTAFSYQTMLPSLTPYLRSHVNHLRFAVIAGTSITLLVYLFWQTLVLGVLPVEGEYGLAKAYELGVPATLFLTHAVESRWLVVLAGFFAFFALVTSFLGIGLGLFDFLADGLHIRKRGWGSLFLILLIALPTLYFALYFERAFLVALDASGGYGDAILNGITPVAMVWVGRYIYPSYAEVGSYRLFGGKCLLLLLLCFFVLSAGITLGNHLGWL